MENKIQREIKFEYGFSSVNGIVKKHYLISEIPFIADKCDVWNVLPIVYVRQFTGLLDKNGNEIYEGDVIQYKEYHVNKRWWNSVSEIPEIEKQCQEQRDNFWVEKRKVEFRDGCFVLGYGLTFQDVDRGYKHTFGQSHSCDTEEKVWGFEIIGNIHENPNLLTPLDTPS